MIVAAAGAAAGAAVGADGKASAGPSMPPVAALPSFMPIDDSDSHSQVKTKYSPQVAALL
jgi:hypothetical protein